MRINNEVDVQVLLVPVPVLLPGTSSTGNKTTIEEVKNGSFVTFLYEVSIVTILSTQMAIVFCLILLTEPQKLFFSSTMAHRPRRPQPNGQRGNQDANQNGSSSNDKKRPLAVAFSPPTTKAAAMPTDNVARGRKLMNHPTATTTTTKTTTAEGVRANNNAKKARVNGIGITVGSRPTPQQHHSSQHNRQIQRPSQDDGNNNKNVKHEMMNDTDATNRNNNKMKERFLKLFEENVEYMNHGISNSILKEHFGNEQYAALVPVINELMTESRLSMSKNMKGELFYALVSEDLANKMIGLDTGARMVYQVIQKAGNIGIWTKIIRNQTNIEQQTLNKIFKTLEQRKLIKPVKSVNAKSKKLYMLYELNPSKELTGGVWYSDFEFDFEFVSELRTFIVQCIKRMNQGQGVTLKEILGKMIQAKICKVELALSDVYQVIQTLIYDTLIEEVNEGNQYSMNMAAHYHPNHPDGIDPNTLYVMARRTTPMCEFKWWNSVLDTTDFKYQRIRFEDNVILSALEPHYHT
jgi:DNA-directed RNA polymerase III subunit RPC6